jgi:RNase P/RNase MRP subunit p29
MKGAGSTMPVCAKSNNHSSTERKGVGVAGLYYCKIIAIARDKVLIKVKKKTLNFWVENMNGKGEPIDGNVLRKNPQAYTRN